MICQKTLEATINTINRKLRKINYYSHDTNGGKNEAEAIRLMAKREALTELRDELIGFRTSKTSSREVVLNGDMAQEFNDHYPADEYDCDEPW